MRIIEDLNNVYLECPTIFAEKRIFFFYLRLFLENLRDNLLFYNSRGKILIGIILNMLTRFSPQKS
jgi:hypothetical protein